MVNEDDLKNYYQDNQDQFTSVEQREASHILVKVDNTGKDVEALQKIIEIQNKINVSLNYVDSKDIELIYGRNRLLSSSIVNELQIKGIIFVHF